VAAPTVVVAVAVVSFKVSPYSGPVKRRQLQYLSVPVALVG
jgi:hypothetical protein